MPAWLALMGALLSGLLTVLSFLSLSEAKRTGRLRFLFWHVKRWGEREESPAFFRTGLAMASYRTVFFAVVTIVLVAFFLETLGVTGAARP